MTASERRRTHSVLPWVILAGTPGVGTAIALLWLGDYSAAVRWSATAGLVGCWVVLGLVLKTHLHRPLRIVANLLAALRQGDYSMRARGAGTNNPLALTLREVNELEELLRSQRLDVAEASGSLRHVLDAVDIAVFAFDEQRVLRLVNQAGEHLIGLAEPDALGKTAADVGLGETLAGAAPRTIERNDPTGIRRWQIRRSAIRLTGRRLTLVVLTDLSSALREEERETWRRLVRVLSHEINNSLTPIKSIVASIRTLLRQDPMPDDWPDDVERGLEIVSGRAEGLERFMSAYARLARLPPPNLVEVDLVACIHRVATLETRIDVTVAEGPAVSVKADPDQLEQALLNLVRNAADAARQTAGGVTVRWRTVEAQVEILIEDEGPGIAETENLFVPFYSTKADGAGIGLALSRHIAESHNGGLELVNRTDVPGARASLRLPSTPLPTNES